MLTSSPGFFLVAAPDSDSPPYFFLRSVFSLRYSRSTKVLISASWTATTFDTAGLATVPLPVPESARRKKDLLYFCGKRLAERAVRAAVEVEAVGLAGARDRRGVEEAAL